jgi:hypothetical protein
MLMTNSSIRETGLKDAPENCVYQSQVIETVNFQLLHLAQNDGRNR